MIKKWYLYIVRCSSGALYTGISRDVTARIKQHNAGKGARSIKALGRPVTLVHCEEFDTKGEALSREASIKRLSKSQKKKLL